jgi:hypothetical protein
LTGQRIDFEKSVPFSKSDACSAFYAQANKNLPTGIRIHNPQNQNYFEPALDQIIYGYSRGRRIPKPEELRAWLNRSVESNPSFVHVCRALSSFGRLGIALPDEARDKYLKVIAQKLDQTDEEVSKNLYSLALLEANGTQIQGTPSGEAALNRLFSRNLSNNASQEDKHRVYLAAQMFDKPHLASAVAESLRSKVEKASNLESNLVASLQNVAKKITSCEITIDNGVWLDSTKSNVDCCISVKNKETGASSKLWVQVDGPTHFMINPQGEDIETGQTVLQNKIVEKYLPQNHQWERVSYAELDGYGLGEAVARELLQQAMALP